MRVSSQRYQEAESMSMWGAWGREQAVIDTQAGMLVVKAKTQESLAPETLLHPSISPDRSSQVD